MEAASPPAIPALSAAPAAQSSAPYFSVIITTWQRQEFLEGAIRSVLAQTVPRIDFEVIVVKGYSDPKLERRFADRGIQFLRAPSRWMSASLGLALPLARGKVVAFLDDDDEFEPTKLAYLREIFDRDPELVAVRHGNRCMDVRGTPLPDWPNCSWPALPPSRVVEVRTSYEKRHRPALPMHNLSSIAARRSAIAPYAAHWAEIEGGTDATVMLLALSTPGTVRADPAVLTRRRVHASTSMDNYSADGLGPPPNLDRIHRLDRVHAQQLALVRGTPAETSARWLEVIHRFEATMASPEVPPPRLTDFAAMAIGLVRERQLFRIWALGFGAARLVIPDRAIRAWWAFSRRREGRRTVMRMDYGRLFARGTEQPSRTSPQSHH